MKNQLKILKFSYLWLKSVIVTLPKCIPNFKIWTHENYDLATLGSLNI